MLHNTSTYPCIPNRYSCAYHHHFILRMLHVSAIHDSRTLQLHVWKAINTCEATISWTANKIQKNIPNSAHICRMSDTNAVTSMAAVVCVYMCSYTFPKLVHSNGYFTFWLAFQALLYEYDAHDHNPNHKNSIGHHLSCITLSISHNCRSQRSNRIRLKHRTYLDE